MNLDPPRRQILRAFHTCSQVAPDPAARSGIGSACYRAAGPCQEPGQQSRAHAQLAGSK